MGLWVSLLSACADGSAFFQSSATYKWTPTATPRLMPTLISTSSPISTPALTPTSLPTQMPTSTRTSIPTLSPTPTTTPVPTKEGWRLVFDEEFDGSALDTQKWDTQYSWGRTNPPEAQYYAPDAFELRQGTLRIKAERRSMQGLQYTSGLIASNGKFQFKYGYVEMRGKVPAGKGLWPAFWLLAENRRSISEIDVMEVLGDAPMRMHMTLHYRDSKGQRNEVGTTFEGVDFSKDFHILAVEWNPEAVIWYVDGVEQFQVTHNVPQEPMYLIANLAVGGNWPGYPDDTTHFPAFFDIDYIRVYQR